jgi:ABC-type transport system involved in multi-copper enzyme maturation permease subunit
VSVFRAMLIDSYRELNNKKMFWIILVLSGLFVLMYASIGFGESGMSIFFGLWNIENEFLTSDSPLSRTLYRAIFSSFVVALWLAWIAVILALISTASIFPDFIAGGSIDLVLCRPVKRVTVFFMKYVSSLLFVAVQVSIVCVGAFLCMGLRLGDWEWRLFAAIPIVLLFFSYLFSICVLVGVWTRSTLAALLLTMLAWFSFYALNQAEAILGSFQAQFTLRLENWEPEAGVEDSADASAATTDDPDASVGSDEVDETRASIETLDKWRKRVRLIKTPFPKTDLTIALLDKLLLRDTDINLMDIMNGNFQMNAQGEFVPQRDQDAEVMVRTIAQYIDRSPQYIIGTSLAFEAVMLGLACFIFVRRDY